MRLQLVQGNPAPLAGHPRSRRLFVLPNGALDQLCRQPDGEDAGLIAIGECAQLPSAADLVTAPQFVFFMDWAELVQTENSQAQVKTLYAADRVLTHDELPGWR